MKSFLIFVVLSFFLSAKAIYATTSILIDPGHSLKSSGTTSCSGKPEYFYNAALAKTIQKYLLNRQMPAELTHEQNDEVNLGKRTKNSHRKSLLLSLHHDSVQPQFLSRHSKSQGYCSEKAKGFSIFVSRKNPYFVESVRYANALGEALTKSGLTPTMHHSEPILGENRKLLSPSKGIYIFDDLVVLKTANSPALLLEAAVIVHPDDDAQSQTSKFQQLIAESVYKALNSGHSISEKLHE